MLFVPCTTFFRRAALVCLHSHSLSSVSSWLQIPSFMIHYLPGGQKKTGISPNHTLIINICFFLIISFISDTKAKRRKDIFFFFFQILQMPTRFGPNGTQNSWQVNTPVCQRSYSKLHRAQQIYPKENLGNILTNFSESSH